MILYINACVREESRTRRLAERLLLRLGGEVKEVDLSQIVFPKVDEAFLRRRDSLAAQGAFSDPLFDYANAFAAAERIVVAAPFWDLSFPAVLKQYLEQICVAGITFCYDGPAPKGLCKARKLYYVTTAGGPFLPDFGYGYVRALAQNFFGIPETILIKAEGLDLPGADVETILARGEAMIRGLTDR